MTNVIVALSLIATILGLGAFLYRRVHKDGGNGEKLVAAKEAMDNVHKAKEAVTRATNVIFDGVRERYGRK